ncbi:MAG: alpha-N-acetylglucosaminidase TIM-barrel domain-containing protein, partial [Oscillospiraceae bacterium]
MGKKEIIQKSAEMKDCRVFDNLEASAVSDLIKRVTGSELYRRKFIIRKKQELKHGYDTFSLFDEGENIVIEANSGVSAAAGFNQYLKKICNCFVGPLSENLNLPENPPCVGKKIESTSLFLYRYFMNYCTYGYTTVFWKFEDYEKLLDWMMLSGINLVLNPVAHEVVWQKLLTELGYSEREIDNYLCGPAYMPWQWMGNMTRFGGDLPKWWYEDRLNLSNKINERLLSFGASPILPGFCGLVPLDFEEKFAGS